MIDRYGRPLNLGWAEHEVLWLQVAMEEGPEALRDLADLTGRSLDAVKTAAYKMRRHERPKMVKAPPPIPKPKVDFRIRAQAEQTAARFLEHIARSSVPFP